MSVGSLVSQASDRSRWFHRRIQAYAPALKRNTHLRFRLTNLVCALLPDFVSGSIRARLYRVAGIRIGSGTSIMGNLDLVSGLDNFYEKLSIGSGVVISNRVTINIDENVIVEDNVSISPHVLIYTGSHPIGRGSNRRLPWVLAKPVTLETGCWVGLGAIVLPGVTVGHGSVVSAGAVVTQSVPPNSYVEGNPARVVRELPLGAR
jgi:maltose O-acetyltransferase